jgi:hypothetical protein
LAALYNLKSGSKIDDYLFPDAPVYTHFSTAGNRLLVLTAQQFAYVIDVDASTSSMATTQIAERTAAR